MGDVMVPQNSMTAAGMNATIMVVTNGDPSGGLYNVSQTSPRHALLLHYHSTMRGRDHELTTTCK